MANLLCSSFLWEKFSFPWSILSFFRSGLPKPHCVWFWQPSRSQKRKNWSRKRKSFSQKRNCAYELFHLSATLFQLLRRFNPNASSYLTGQMDKFSWCIFLWEKLPSYNRAWLLNVSNQVHLYPLLKREIYNMQESSKAKLEFEPKTSLTCN